MWLMKTLLTSGCTNQRGAGQKIAKDFLDLEKKYQVLLQVKFFTHLLI
ncbi:hypothetical protein [Escherichia coli]|nr:hypothetical protein [Escherichia coli]